MENVPTTTESEPPMITRAHLAARASLAAAARVAATKNQMVKLALRLFAEQYLDFDITAPAPKSEPAADDLPPT